jgi:putative SOS response-associated peptidase YedK
MFGPSLGSRHVAPYIARMCGRVVQASEPLRYAFVDGLSVPDSRIRPPSYNVAPSQELYVIRHNHKTGERTLDLLRWGLIPHGCKDPSGDANRSTRGRKALQACRPFARPTRSGAVSLPLKASLSGEPSKEPEQSNNTLSASASAALSFSEPFFFERLPSLHFRLGLC